MENEEKALRPDEAKAAPTSGTPEETEALRAMREAYEEKLKEKDQELANARSEHARQIREILLNGRKPEEKKPVDDQEEETEEERQKRIAREIANKILRR